jgi:hypothetical protein
MNVWNQIFKTRTKGEPWPVSPQQCSAARAVFGGSLAPETEARCAAYKSAIKAVAKEQSAKIIGGLQTTIEQLNEEFLSIDERLRLIESAQIEEKMFTSRLSAAMFADDPAGSLAAIGHKEKTPPPADWIDRAAHIAGDDANQKRKGTANQPLHQKLSPGQYRRRNQFDQ